MDLEIWFQGLTGAERGRNKCICPWMSNVWVRERMLIWEAYKDYFIGMRQEELLIRSSYVFTVFFFLEQTGLRTNKLHD